MYSATDLLFVFDIVLNPPFADLILLELPSSRPEAQWASFTVTLHSTKSKHEKGERRDREGWGLINPWRILNPWVALLLLAGL